jgi:hypothetical protein
MSVCVKIVLFMLTIGCVGALAGFFSAVSKLEVSAGLHMLFVLCGPSTPPADLLLVSLERETTKQLNLPGNFEKVMTPITRLTESSIAQSPVCRGIKNVQQSVVAGRHRRIHPGCRYPRSGRPFEVQHQSVHYLSARTAGYGLGRDCQFKTEIAPSFNSNRRA